MELHVDLGPLASLPEWYWTVPYEGSRFPRNVSRGDLQSGANCQLWAFEVLSWFGYVMADLRSDELWRDTVWSARVDDPEPLDLVLYNDHDEPYGAHVGVWTGSAVAHLAFEAGRPTVWTHAEFEARPRYSTRIGFKRPQVRS